MTARVSIVIPTYNRAALLEEAIRSALAQAYASLEVLVVDNASTDNTSQIVQAFSDPRLRYVRNAENLGMVGNFRRALELAQGEYICFLSSDDVLKPGFITWAASALDMNPACSFAFGNVEAIGGTAPRQHRPFASVTPGKTYVTYSLKRAENPTFLCSALARRTLVSEIGIDNLTFFDWAMWLRLAWRGDVCYTAEPVAMYRFHAENETKKISYSTHLNQLSQAVEALAAHEVLTPDVQRYVRTAYRKLYRNYTSVIGKSITLSLRDSVTQLRECHTHGISGLYIGYAWLRCAALRVLMLLRKVLSRGTKSKMRT